MKKSLMNKFTLKILSLLIAILIWLLVMNIENPSITQTYTDIPVTFVNESYIESMNNIALMVDGKDSVNVRIRAVSDTIKKLNKENITAVADLTQIIDMDSDPAQSFVYALLLYLSYINYRFFCDSMCGILHAWCTEKDE